MLTLNKIIQRTMPHYIESNSPFENMPCKWLEYMRKKKIHL